MTTNSTETHPLPSVIHFFKVILDTTLQRGKLMIPTIFTQKYGANLANPVFLKLPDGTEWEVCWTKDGAGNIWFEKGWKEFITYYSISEGHFVVFKYQQTCKLEVHIFDTGAVEINYPSNGTQNHSTEVLFEMTPTTSSGPKPCKKLRTHSSGVVGQNPNLPQRDQIKVDDESRDGAIRSKTPSFTVVMKESYVNGYLLVIPSTFARRYLKEKGKHDILLQVLDGRTWPVTLKEGKFCTGWNTFASNNRLSIGDVCIFELTKSQDLCFKVSIIRIVEDKFSSSQVQGDGELMKTSDLECMTTVPIKEFILKSCGFVVMSFTNGAMQKAASFTSENPFFKLNIKGNIKGDCRPRIPLAFVRKYFYEKQAVTLQLGNKSWLVKLVGEIPTKLSNGWTQFAKECMLQYGNVCVFELINREDLVFNVHIFRGQS